MEKLDPKIQFYNFENTNDTDPIDYSKRRILSSLYEMFPLVPKELFHPLIKLNESEMSDHIIKLTNVENNDDKIKYLSKLSIPENVLVSTGINGESNHPFDEYEIPSTDDDKVLADLEEENEKCLVLGRTFIKEAHKMFSSKFGLQNVNIDDIPPEITEMRWKLSENLMLTLYQGFFEEIGLIETKDCRKPITDPLTLPVEKLTMKEIMDLETALHNSTEDQRKAIHENEALSIQMDTLVLKYPEISRDELQRVFISCNMDTSLTIQELSNAGHSSQIMKSRNGSPRQNKITKNNNNNNSKRNVESNALQAQRFEKRIDLEINRIRYVQEKLNLQNAQNLQAQIANYWREELRQARDRLIWYQERLALANEAQQSVLSNNRQLDLHGFTQTSAVAAVQQRIDKIRSSSLDLRKGGHLIIICGRGLHSWNGRPRLKPAVRQHLQQAAIEFQESFEGTFRVPLKQFVPRR